MKTIFFCFILLSVPAASLSAQVAQGINIGAGTIFSLGGATLSLPNHWTNSGTFNAGTGTVILNGPNSYQVITNISGETFQNLTIDKASSLVMLNADVTVNGNLTITRGDLNTNGHAITMGAGALLNETVGNTVMGSGSISGTMILNVPSGINAFGLGATITSPANLGSTVIRRGHTKQTIGSDSSILRYYDIVPTNNAGLNATLAFHYDISELNGIPDSSLCLSRSSDGGLSWQKTGGIANIPSKTVTLNSIGSFSRWTLTSKYTATAPSAAPVLVLPVNGAINQPITLTLKWRRTANAARYQCQVSIDTSFAVLACNDSTLTDTLKQVLLQNLTVYYWRVCATNAVGAGPYSMIDSFTTVVSVPDRPTLAWPANGAAGVASNVVLRWQSAARASRYRLQVSVDTLFTSCAIHDSTLTDTMRQVTQLAYSKKFYWRVQAANAGGTSDWSIARNFTTRTTSVEELEGIPTQFALMQNYPNPFNPSTLIRYDLPQSAYVRIVVFDMLGREVAKLVNGVQRAAKYRIEWRPSGLSCGLYFCRIQAAEFSAVRKMLLLK